MTFNKLEITRLLSDNGRADSIFLQSSLTLLLRAPFAPFARVG